MPGTVLRVKNLIFIDQHGFDIKSPASHKSNRELLTPFAICLMRTYIAIKQDTSIPLLKA